MSTKTTKTTKPDFLSRVHAHFRDQYIRFFEYGHKYVIQFPSKENTIKNTSVTTWIHRHFPAFDSDKIIQNIFRSKHFREGHKYWGLTAAQIKQKWSDDAQLGTDLHYRIECFMNFHYENHSFFLNESTKEEEKKEEEEKEKEEKEKEEEEKEEEKEEKNKVSFYCTHKDLLKDYYENQAKDKSESEVKEWEFFLQFVQDTPELVPYRTEWIIFHEEIHLAGSIDMVYINKENGKLAIYDWKRCLDISSENPFHQFASAACISYLPDTKYWHYALQLNLYKFILEDKYDKEVSEMYLIRLHPTATGYEKIEVPNLQDEIRKMIGEVL
jgi:hypothetical protein